MMSYFGTDQSQVQRYLSGKSLKEMQLGMIFNGIFKIPMQFFILLLGVMVFVFFDSLLFFSRGVMMDADVVSQAFQRLQDGPCATVPAGARWTLPQLI